MSDVEETVEVVDIGCEENECRWDVQRFQFRGKEIGGKECFPPIVLWGNSSVGPKPRAASRRPEAVERSDAWPLPCDAYADTNGHTHCDSDGHSDINSHAHSDFNEYTDANGYLHCDGDINP